MDDIGWTPLVGSAFLAVGWIVLSLPIGLFAVCPTSGRAKEWSRAGLAGFFTLTGLVLLILPLRTIFQLEPEQVFNLFEAYLWIAIAVSLFAARRKQPAHGSGNVLATVSFFLFGVSDLIEMHTGAWYRPWPLLMLKSACVLGLLVALAWHTASKTRRDRERLP